MHGVTMKIHRKIFGLKEHKSNRMKKITQWWAL